MKKQIFLLAVFTFILLLGCNPNKKSEEVASYTYNEEVVASNNQAAKKVGDWVEEGTVCYGLVVSVDKDGKQIVGKPVKAKVIKLGETEIKMKALENVNVAPVKGCSKMGLKKGESWTEKDGDLFKTKEEAIAFLKDKNLFNE